MRQQLILAVLDPQASGLHDLEAWLRRDPELRGVLIRPLAAAPQPGEMGQLSQALEVVVENRELFTALITTVGVWLQGRTRHTRLKIRDGSREIEVESDQVSDPAQLAAGILEGLGGTSEAE